MRWIPFIHGHKIKPKKQEPIQLPLEQEEKIPNLIEAPKEEPKIVIIQL